MKRLLFRVLLAVLLAGLVTAAFGAAPSQAPLGLKLSLTTSGFRFEVPGEDQPANSFINANGTRIFPRTSFTASVILQNLSREDASFEFPTGPSAARLFRFRILDSVGPIWESVAIPETPASTVTSTLRRQSAWKRTEQIPLRLNGRWLLNGRYTLEATLVADPSVQTVTPFEVVSPTLPPPDTGLQGQVMTYDYPVTLPPSGYTHVPSANPVLDPQYSTPARARVSITAEPGTNASAAAQAFSWEGETDEAGNYQVVVPPGRYLVTARELDNGGVIRIGGPAPKTPIYRATVTAGQFNTQNIALYGLSQAALEFRPVHRVTEVSVSVGSISYIWNPTGMPLPSKFISIHASGTIHYAGTDYTKIRYRGRAADGFDEYDFVFAVPNSPQTNTETAVSTPSIVSVFGLQFSEPFIGTRVYSETNSMEAKPKTATP